MTQNAEYGRVYEHLDHITEEAGLGVMGSGGVLGIVADRGEVPASYLLTLTAEHMEPLYGLFIGPAIDKLEAYLSREAQNDSSGAR